MIVFFLQDVPEVVERLVRKTMIINKFLPNLFLIRKWYVTEKWKFNNFEGLVLGCIEADVLRVNITFATFFKKSTICAHFGTFGTQAEHHSKLNNLPKFILNGSVLARFRKVGWYIVHNSTRSDCSCIQYSQIKMFTFRYNDTPKEEGQEEKKKKINKNGSRLNDL